jgi:hypothetical protein
MQFQSIDQPTYCPTMMRAKPFQVRGTRWHEYFAGLEEVIRKEFQFTVPGHGTFQLIAMDAVVANICALRSWVEDLASGEREARVQVREIMDRHSHVSAAGLVQRVNWRYLPSEHPVISQFFRLDTNGELSNEAKLGIVYGAIDANPCSNAVDHLLKSCHQKEYIGIVNADDLEDMKRWGIEAVPILEKHRNEIAKIAKALKSVFGRVGQREREDEDGPPIFVLNQAGECLEARQLACLKQAIFEHLHELFVANKEDRDGKKVYYEDEEEGEGDEGSDEEPDEEPDDDEDYLEEEEDEEDDDEDDDEGGEQEERGTKRKRTKGGGGGRKRARYEDSSEEEDSADEDEHDDDDEGDDEGDDYCSSSDDEGN